MAGFHFSVLARDSLTRARAGRVQTGHGSFDTPAFMPVGTQGSVKALTQEMLEQAGAEIILSNTYHLYLRPGHSSINRLGGLHRFMSWKRPILTDSGGFQVFSLGDLRKIGEEGVEFRSHVDGTLHFLSPERAAEIQVALGSDVAMVLDECTAYPCDYDEARLSVELTTRWARRCKEEFQRLHSDPRAATGAGLDVVNPCQAVFGINQGSIYPDLRERSLENLVEVGFDGYGIGGLSVGEEKGRLFEVVNRVAPKIPEDRPRYLMGVGAPEDIVEAVSLGVDMFDCVLPTRNARNGQLFTGRGRINIKNARYKEDDGPVDEACGCSVCARYSKAYIRHLYLSGEILGSVLSSFHNVWFYLDTMLRIRQAITFGTFDEFRKSFLNDLALGQG